MRGYGDLLWWSGALVIGVPVVVVILGELSLRLSRSKSRYLHFVQLLRSVLLPALVVVLLIRAVFSIDEARLASRLSLTVLLISITYVGLVFFRNVTAEKRIERWENRIPGLFKILLRIAIVVVPIFVLFDTWGVDLSSNLSALGIGGVAIAFALQDAIGNVVSGVLLILDRPFSVGDWIEVDGLQGEVIDVSWRSTRISVDNDVMILPNITLSNSSIRNLTAIDPAHSGQVDFAFGGDDRPSVVKQMLIDVATDNPEISTAQKPAVHLIEYGDSSNTYRLHYNVDRYRGDFHAQSVKEQLRTTVFHAHSRYGLSMPFPTVMHLTPDTVDLGATADQAAAVEFLRWNPVFALLSDDVLERLARQVEPRSYAVGETILSQLRRNDRLYVVFSGEVQLTRPDEASPDDLDVDLRDRPLTGAVAERFVPSRAVIGLRVGDLLGEDAIVSQVGGGWHASAVTDVELYALDVQLVSSIAEQHPRFAAAINALMIERRRVAASVSSIPSSDQLQMVPHDAVKDPPQGSSDLADSIANGSGIPSGEEPSDDDAGGG